MSKIYSFPPIAAANAKLLILGSIPGKASLAANQYYAHPRNLFWTLLGELVGAHPTLDYAERAEILKANGIAVWDVLKSCLRQGSLDADIDKSSIIANDFAEFFTAHAQISRVYFNGGLAESSFRKHVLPTLKTQSLMFQRLPSTSPAHAAITYRQKLQIWNCILENSAVC